MWVNWNKYICKLACILLHKICMYKNFQQKHSASSPYTVLFNLCFFNIYLAGFPKEVQYYLYGSWHLSSSSELFSIYYQEHPHSLAGSRNHIKLKLDNETIEYTEITRLSISEAWQFVFDVHFSSKTWIEAVWLCCKGFIVLPKIHSLSQGQIASKHECEYWRKSWIFQVTQILVDIFLCYTH